MNKTFSVLILVLGFTIVSSLGIAYAATIITLDADVVVIGDLNVIGTITGTTITDLDSRITILEGAP